MKLANLFEYPELGEYDNESVVFLNRIGEYNGDAGESLKFVSEC